MDKRLTHQFRAFSLGILVLAVLFFVFFDRAKHVPMLEAVNPFNVDPYDAVGSFGVLLGLFTALLTLLRAFRPYAGGGISASGIGSILRGAVVVISSVAVTLVADSIAVLRHVPETLGSPGGRTLIGLIVALAIVNAWGGRWLRIRMYDLPRSHDVGPWWRPILMFAASAVILATYPPEWGEGIAGGILTALLGMLILFAAVWALTTVIFPASEAATEDVIDDLAAIYNRLKGRLGFLAGRFRAVERFAGHPMLKSLVGWLNPRRHPWNGVTVGGVLLGLALAAAEALGEGISPQAGRFVLVGSVFVVIATSGVLVGYGLLGRFLGLHRSPNRDADR